MDVFVHVAKMALAESSDCWSWVRYLYSMDLLRSGQSVKEVAFTLGYNQASPFISMFKKYAGQTPEQYKSRLL